MGWHGFSIPLKQLDQPQPQSERAVDEAARKLLCKYFRASLSRAWAKKACRWVDWGMDSLVELHEPNEKPSENPLDELSFWFYDTGDWPVSLARHWILTALHDTAGCDFFSMLRRHGYALADGAPVPKPTSVLIEEGARIGLLQPKGVEWQEDPPVFVADADLSEALRKRVLAARTSVGNPPPPTAIEGDAAPNEPDSAGHDEALEGLLVDLDDRSLPSRIASWNGVVAHLDVAPALLEAHQTPLRVLKTRILTQLPSVYKAGAVIARDAFRSLAQGQSAAGLGLAYVAGPPEWVAQVWEAMRVRDGETLGADAIAAMSGHDRDWAEALVVLRLGTYADVRAVRSLAALGWRQLVPVLDEALEKYAHVDAFCAEARRVRAVLAGAEGSL